ncbi:ABC transporter ATP-binding protein [Candidatus Phytoplasma fraxini]|uniref:Oligopeptide ABC transporter, ATP-binding protein (OppF) n=1 Tax=Ash yellows phytoplasma TaxID=35780 RepID=A0ABZ2U9G0_ASHYP
MFQKPQFLTANQNINLSIFKGETLSIVGESGSGKSTLGQLILQLQKNTSGNIFYYQNEFNKINLTELDKKKQRLLRKELQIIFQDPFSSLNPFFKISDIIGEGLLIHKMVKNKKDPLYKEKILDIMEKCQIDKSLYKRYPTQLSGGQRQRIAIARTLIIQPKFIVCDEIVSALDVSTQSKILDLLNNLKEKYKLTFMFITHDLGVAGYLSDRICVMYLGNIVELGTKQQILKNPSHPYTQKILNATPKLNNQKQLEYKIIYENPKFKFLFDKNEKDLDWLEIEPQHFIRCTLKKRLKQQVLK